MPLSIFTQFSGKALELGAPAPTGKFSVGIVSGHCTSLFEQFVFMGTSCFDIENEVDYISLHCFGFDDTYFQGYSNSLSLSYQSFKPSHFTVTALTLTCFVGSCISSEEKVNVKFTFVLVS